MPDTPCLSCGKPFGAVASRCPHCGNARTVAEGASAQPGPEPDAWWLSAPVPSPPPAILPRVAPRPARTEEPRPPLDIEPSEAQPLPAWVVGAGLAGIAGIALLVAVAALPRGEPKPPLGPPPVVVVPPARTRERIAWPKGAPLLARFALPWEAKGLLAGLPPDEKPPVVFTPIDVKLPPLTGPINVKRLRDADEAALRKEAAASPEVALYAALPRKEAARVARGAKGPLETRPDRLAKDAALAGLPLRFGDECRLPTAATAQDAASVALRALVRGTDPAGTVRALHTDTGPGSKWLRPEGVPALEQTLMAGPEPVREALVEMLGRIDGKAASLALAKRALFDLDPRIRELAVRGLAKRPVADWMPALRKGLRHPWPAAAEHAAEALAALRRTDAVPALLAGLQEADPLAPFDRPGKGPHVREMVRVNHGRNCLLCHAPSGDPADRLRAPCPATDSAMEPSGAFVRADVTYLRQDFALALPVAKPGMWPPEQRFDFVVRECRARAGEKPPAAPTAHQRAAMFALRELTGQDAGPSPADWAKAFFGRELEARTWHTGFRSARAFAVSERKAYVADSGTLWRKEGDARPEPLMKDGAGISALAFDSGGRLLAACGKTKQLLAIDLATRSEKTVASGPGRERFQSPARLAADALGGCWLADGAGETGAVYHVTGSGTATRLLLPVARPRALALSPDGKTLALAGAGSSEVWLFPVEGAGLLGKGRRLVKLPGAVADLAIAEGGLMCALDAAAHAVEIVNQDGHRLARARLPDAPVACAAVGKSLTVLTRSSLLTIDLGTVLP